MPKYTVDIIRQIWDEKEHGTINVGPSPDLSGNVALYTNVSTGGDGFFGKIFLDMPAEFMRLVGQALIQAADEAKQEPKS